MTNNRSEAALLISYKLGYSVSIKIQCTFAKHLSILSKNNTSSRLSSLSLHLICVFPQHLLQSLRHTLISSELISHILDTNDVPVHLFDIHNHTDMQIGISYNVFPNPINYFTIRWSECKHHTLSN